MSTDRVALTGRDSPVRLEMLTRSDFRQKPGNFLNFAAKNSRDLELSALTISDPIIYSLVLARGDKITR